MRFSEEEIQKAMGAVGIVQLMESYGVRFEGDGVRGNRNAYCPFHEDVKTPSLSVHTTKKVYHCFGCGKSGNIITFVMEIRDVGFRTAVKELLGIAKNGGMLHERP